MTDVDLREGLPSIRAVSLLEEIPDSDVSLRRAATLKRLSPIGEHSYSVGTGTLYTARSYSRTIKASRTVDIYVALNDDPIGFLVGRTRLNCKSAVFLPLVPRTVMDYGSGFVCVSLNPRHVNFRQFSTITSEKVRVLDHELFRPLNRAIRDACLGDLDLHHGINLLSNITSLAAANLPQPKPLDPRVVATKELLQADPNRSLKELASAVSLSYHRLSHLFSESIGLSLRSFQLWLKIDRAWRHVERGESIANVAKLSGFSDAAHLCHVFQDSYGVPLAHHLRNISRRVNCSAM